MKILSAAEIRDWDQYTIQHEPIASIDLMERAATACVNWLTTIYPDAPSFGIFCGKGNNGGDGLAIARILMDRKYLVTIHILDPIAIGFGHMGTDDFQSNLARLHALPDADIHFVQSEDHLHSIPQDQVLVDALFGSGLNRALDGVTALLVEHINNSGSEIVSIDIPSGLFTDHSSKGALTVHARHTLSFQCYKPAFLFAENQDSIGEIHILDIGLHPEYYKKLQCRFELVDEDIIHSVYKARNRFAHKGNFGHALLVAGSYGKMGAAVLAAKACMRSGVGLLTCHIPKCGYQILQTAVPEAMVLTDINSSFNTKIVRGTLRGSPYGPSGEDDLSGYETIGIGPGIGTASETKMMLREIFDAYRSPVVLDADALNIMASQKELLKLIPAGSILTPHPKEFERLFGETLPAGQAGVNDFDRMLLALQKAKEHSCIIVLKGHRSFIATADGRGFFNSTGNPGMATAGSGDVLTGILTGLLAQGYSSVEAAILGVYLHGLAGDFAAIKFSQEAMVSGDIIDCLSESFKRLGPVG